MVCTVQLFAQKRVAFKSFTDQYVTVNSETSPLIANKTVAGEMEAFEIVELVNNQVALKSSTGKYVCADETKNDAVIADREKVGPWETFTAEKFGATRIAFKSYKGKYISVGVDNTLAANRVKRSEWETFTMLPMKPATPPPAPTPLNTSGETYVKVISECNKYGFEFNINGQKVTLSSPGNQMVKVPANTAVNIVCNTISVVMPNMSTMKVNKQLFADTKTYAAGTTNCVRVTPIAKYPFVKWEFVCP